MKLLLHVCCAPCSIIPLKILQEEKINTDGYFINPNIHPYREFQKRIVGVQQLSEILNVKIYINEQYGLKEYLRKVVYNEPQRCTICYTMRLEATAIKACELGYDAFSTTLLYSKYQNHGYIRKIGEELALRYNKPFHYCDFRAGWQEGIDKAIALNLYRQAYCGCIYSENERYDKTLRKQNIKEKNHD